MPIPAAIPIAMMAGSTAANIYNALNPPQMPNIQEYIDQIRSLYNTAREQGRTALFNQLGQLNALDSSNLAGRGVYSSPVSQWSFARNNFQMQNAYSDLLANLAAQEANAVGGLYGKAFDYNAAQSGRKNAAIGSLFADLGNAGMGLYQWGQGQGAPGQPQQVPNGQPMTQIGWMGQQDWNNQMPSPIAPQYRPSVPSLWGQPSQVQIPYRRGASPYGF